MKRITLLMVLCLMGAQVFAQDYETPDSGVNWGLEDLMNNSPETVSNDAGVFVIEEDFTVAESDTLTIAGAVVHLNGDVRVTVEGTFISQGTEDGDNVFDASDETVPYEGFRFEEESEVHIDKTTIKNGGGLKVITPNFTITNSMLTHNVSGVSSGAVISFSHGSPLVQDNTFLENDLPAVSSPANGDVSAEIIDNIIKKNTQSNQNRPQINMGTTGGDTLKIIGNTIVGDRNMDMAGGIAVANLIGGEVNAVIQDNTISDNRYGITVAGAAYAMIDGNIIEDNDTQGEPNLGGSGISVNSTEDNQTIIVTDNQIRGNLWGITIIGQGSMNLGDDQDNPGGNVFSENGNNGETFALYNNTPNTILAKHNCWIEGEEITLEDAAEVIVDQADDDSLGEVIYDPMSDECSTLSVPEYAKNGLAIYPNPATDIIRLDNQVNLKRVSIYTLDGKRIQENQLQDGENTLSVDKLSSGLYLLKFTGSKGSFTKKLIIK